VQGFNWSKLTFDGNGMGQLICDEQQRCLAAL
jgi:hypothetical protein